MATLTIRNLDEDLKSRIRIRAARRGHSMEEEARRILHAALATSPDDDSGASLYAAFRARVEPLGGIDLEIPVRTPLSDPNC